jgi:hypothetical protein
MITVYAEFIGCHDEGVLRGATLVPWPTKELARVYESFGFPFVAKGIMTPIQHQRDLLYVFSRKAQTSQQTDIGQVFP